MNQKESRVRKSHGIFLQKGQQKNKNILPIVFLDVRSAIYFDKEGNFLLLHKWFQLLRGQLSKALTPVSPIHFFDNVPSEVRENLFRGAWLAYRTK